MKPLQIVTLSKCRPQTAKRALQTAPFCIQGKIQTAKNRAETQSGAGVPQTGDCYANIVQKLKIEKAASNCTLEGEKFTFPTKAQGSLEN